MTQAERDSQGAVWKVRDREDTAARSVHMAGARADPGRAGGVPQSPWHGEVALTKDISYTGASVLASGFCHIILPGLGQWLGWIRCLCHVWDTRDRSTTCQGALCSQPLPGPRVAACRGRGEVRPMEM